jgi:hypothetical protein
MRMRRSRLTGLGYYRSLSRGPYVPWGEIPEGMRILFEWFARQTPTREKSVFNHLDDFLWATECSDPLLLEYANFIGKGTMADFEWSHGTSAALQGFNQYLRGVGALQLALWVRTALYVCPPSTTRTEA